MCACVKYHSEPPLEQSVYTLKIKKERQKDKTGPAQRWVPVEGEG
jgi:hypothetical protein